MELIDAHAHVFETLAGFGADGELRAAGNGKAVWATGEVIDLIPAGYGDVSFTAESLIQLMDQSNIRKAVLLQGGFLGFENSYLKEVGRRYPDRFRVSATFDPFCRNAGRILDNLLKDFTVFKFEMSTGCGIMGSHADFALDAPFMMDIYRRLSDSGCTVVFDLGSPGDGSNQPDAVGRIADAFPSMQIVVCHLMSPRRQHEKALREGLEMMDRSNIAFDISALHHKVRPEEYPFPTAQRFIRIAIDMLGAERLMWGTDAPSTLVKYSVSELTDYVRDILSEDEQKLIFRENAERIYFSQA